ncbi:MAG: tetratricopeptide repeat protein [Myxococcales bacterium]|nr:tetratricopeptide repeat protein [Myxococcales bacterium]
MTLQELSAISGPEMLEMAVIGFSMYEQGKYDDARVVFQGLSTLDPKEGYYRTALGAVFLAQENLEAAEDCFNQAIKLNASEIASYVNRGEVYLRQGKILEAAQDFKRAVDLDPENKDPLSQRARILAAAALETLEAARAEALNQQASGKAAAKSPSKPAAKPASAKAKVASKGKGSAHGRKK